MSFVVLSKADAKKLRRALRQQENLPARGTTVYGSGCTFRWEPPETCEVDDEGDPLPTPGYTIDNLPEGDEDGDTVAIEVPARLEKFAGKKVKGVDVPALTAEADLPAGVKAVREAKRAAKLEAREEKAEAKAEKRAAKK